MDPRQWNFALDTCPVACPLLLNRANMRGNELVSGSENYKRDKIYHVWRIANSLYMHFNCIFSLRWTPGSGILHWIPAL